MTVLYEKYTQKKKDLDLMRKRKNDLQKQVVNILNLEHQKKREVYIKEYTKGNKGYRTDILNIE